MRSSGCFLNMAMSVLVMTLFMITTVIAAQNKPPQVVEIPTIEAVQNAPTAVVVQSARSHHDRDEVCDLCKQHVGTVHVCKGCLEAIKNGPVVVLPPPNVPSQRKTTVQTTADYQSGRWFGGGRFGGGFRSVCRPFGGRFAGSCSQ